MTQLELFTQSEIDDQSYHVVIPANPLVKPGSAEAVKMTDTSGQKYFPLFSKSDQIGLFVKTFLDTSLWASTRCFLTWQTKPITQSKHFILELSVSMPDIDVCESGLSQEMWATPNTMDHLPQRSKEALERQANTTRKGRTRPANLREQVNPETVEAWEKAQEPQMWPTPIASTGGPYKNHKGNEKKIPSSGNPLATAVAMWPTPLAQEAKHGKVTQWEMETDHAATKNSLRVAVAKQMWPTPNASDSKQANMKDDHDLKKGYLRGVVKMYPTPTASLEKHSTKEAYWENRIQKGRQEDIQMRVYKETGSGSLNPQWVEWLMGYPEGWTDLKD